MFLGSSEEPTFAKIPPNARVVREEGALIGSIAGELTPHFPLFPILYLLVYLYTQN